MNTICTVCVCKDMSRNLIFFSSSYYILIKNMDSWEFHDSPVVRTLCFYCQGCGFNPWLENQDLTSCSVRPKNKTNNSKISTVDGKTTEFCGISSEVQMKKRINYLFLCISIFLDLLQGKKNRDERRSGQWWRVVCRRKSVFKWKIYFATCKESDILRWSNENFFRPTHDKLP